MHCSKPDQLAGVVNRYYQGQTGLIVLHIDPDLVEPSIRWENPPGRNEQFPHIYGPLNLNAVIEVNSAGEARRNVPTPLELTDYTTLRLRNHSKI